MEKRDTAILNFFVNSPKGKKLAWTHFQDTPKHTHANFSTQQPHRQAASSWFFIYKIILLKSPIITSNLFFEDTKKHNSDC